jgi:filamentous hemagglutinin family protein
MQVRFKYELHAQGRVVAAIGLCALGTAAAGTAPPLPTPCLAGNCPNTTTGSTRSFVSYGSAGAVVTGNTLNVTQSTATAILNWANFNIASGYKVNYIQPSATAEILNNIWSANPTVIAGALNANGQVYLYNQNGIVFDKGAQINVAGLTASTLNFAPQSTSTDVDALFKNGILSGNSNIVNTGVLPAVFQAAAGASGTPYAGTVTVEPGAQLTAASGGRIMLLGSAVTNGGSITTPDGQTLIGAGNTVYLAASSDPALRGLLIEVNANGGVGSVVDAVTNQSVAIGTVVNQTTGQISAPRGNVTLAGMVVNQAGLVSATTSVGENGSIYLVAGDTSATTAQGAPVGFYNDGVTGFGQLLPTVGGTLTLPATSVNQVAADTTDTSTISAANLAAGEFLKSRIALVGESITMQGGASIKAPGATVNLYAASSPDTAIIAEADNTAYNGGGEIYLAPGSRIDVSGLTNVPVAATQDILQVTLETTDLADDPLLRTGFLHGTTVTINTNQGSTLFNVAPYAANIGIGIDQVLTTGGSIEMSSGGEVITRAGSTLNVSGGSVAFQGAYGRSTTDLLAANGQVYNISDAPSSLQYIGIANSYSYTDPTWGTQTKGSAQTYYNGYMQGANAGQIEVLGPSVYLRGTMTGTTVVGTYQSGAPASGGQFLLGCSCQNVSLNGLDYRAPAVEFANGATDDLTTAQLVNLPSVTTLSPTALSAGGFDQITIFSNGPVTLPAGNSINLAVGGALNVTTDQSVQIDGNITVPSGSVTLVAKAGPADFSVHDVTLGAGAIIDVSGNWINDSVDSPVATPATTPTLIGGGAVSLSASGNVVLGAGSLIDVSGGGWINGNNKLSAGSAGSISLSASYISSVTAAYSGLVSFGDGAELVGDSLAAGKGGALSIQSGSVTVGSITAGTPGELLLAPTFFANQGFQSYTITGQNDVLIGGSIASNGSPLTIAPIQDTLIFTRNPLLVPTGSSLASFTQLTVLPETERSPANISFATTASAVVGTGPFASGDIVLAANAAIVTDPQATVTLDAKGYTGSISVYGSITAPAGTINLDLGTLSAVGSSSDPGYLPNQEILLGPTALLAAPSYAAINTLDAQGYAQGSLLPGGTIAIQANKGYVVTDPGSVINVRGTSGVIDVVSTQGVVPTLVTGGGGGIDINAREGLVLQGTLDGQAATAANGTTITGAAGGSLVLGLGAESATSGAGSNAFLFDYYSTANSNNQNTSGTAYTPYPLTTRTLTLSDQAATALPTSLQSGVAQISVGTIEAGGFDNVALESADVIALDGAVSLTSRSTLVLDAPLLQGNPGASAHLSSAYVGLGNYFNNTNYFNATYGGNPNAANVQNPACGSAASCTAALSVTAQLLDIRGLSAFSGFTSDYLTSSGDIRLTSAQNLIGGDLGTSATPNLVLGPPGDTSIPNIRSGLQTTGNLTLEAVAIYPTTNTDFTITDLNAGGAYPASTVTIAPAVGTSTTPLSAGGSLTINAPTVAQGGTVLAPMGQITLQGVDAVDASTGLTVPGVVVLAPGSLTSVSAGGQILPYGSTVNGQQWTYSPDSVITEAINSPPAKTISLTSSIVSVGGNNSSVGNANVNLAGGGELYAYEWIAGPGGSTDVLNPTSAANQAGLKPYQYAIVPSLGSQFAPIDAQYAQGWSGTGNQTIYLSGVPGLAAGYYALLPPRYALLPGAFALSITPNTNIQAGSVVAQPNGSYLAAGKLGVAGTGIVASQTATVLIAPASVVNTESQYTATYANSFFSSAAAATSAAAASGAGTASATVAPSLPADAGQLQITANQVLALNGAINFATGSYTTTNAAGKTSTVQGSGGGVSIVAPSILVVDSATPASVLAGSTAVELSAQSLNSLGAQTLILGGSEQNTATGTVISAGSTQNIELDNASVALTGPQIILTALNQISFDAGAKLSATGTLSQPPSALTVEGAGALLLASSGAAPTLELQSSAAAGELTIGAKAALQASGNLLLYSSGNTTAQADATISAPALGFYSSRVSIGDVPTGTAAPAGLNLTASLLSQLTGLTELTIGSTSTIDLYGNVNLGTATSANPGLTSITLDAWAVDGYGGGGKNLQAAAITLSNTNPTGSEPADLYVTPPDGTGALTLRSVASTASQSGQISVDAGAKTLNGFSAVSVAADGDIEATAGGSLTVVGSNVPLSLQGAALTAAAAVNQTITTTGAMTIAPASASKAVIPAAPLGGELALVGSSIMQGGTIDLPAGIVSLEATSGNLVLAAGSVTAAAGSSQNFTVTHAVAAAGQISLAADQGNVTIASGATVNLAGTSSPSGSLSGDAGSLTVAAPQGLFNYAGSTIAASAPAGQLQGNFSLDVGSGLGGSGFSALNGMLAASGLTGDIALRSRGDGAVTIAATDTVNASSFELSADQGTITVAGTINTSGGNAFDPDGGTIALWAGAGLTLQGGAHLLANGGAPGPLGVNNAALATHGGDITLGTTNGTLTIDGGSAQAPTIISMQGDGDAGTDGTLTLRAPRTSDDSNVQIVVQNAANAQIATRAPIIVEGYKAYDATLLGGAGTDDSCGSVGGTCDVGDTSGLLFTDAQSFIANAPSIVSNLGLGNNTVQVRPGIEIDSPGDLTVGDGSFAGWDLDSWNLALGAPVNVTLRAAGNLIFNASLSDGFKAKNQNQAILNWVFGEDGVVVGSIIDSGSYRLTAGADLSAANPLAVIAQPVPTGNPQQLSSEVTAGVPNSGNLILTPGNLIRTGDGSIGIAAGGDVLIGYSEYYDGNNNLQISAAEPLSSVIYTAGVPSQLTPAQAALFTSAGTNKQPAGFGQDGGNITISASDDIVSVPSAQLVSDWEFRRSTYNVNGAPVVDTAWWVYFNNFQQGIGALGGGNIDLTAGGNITNVSAVIPSTGRLLIPTSGTPASADLIVDGGGYLRVQAGGNVDSGVFQDDWGNAAIRAGGALDSGAYIEDETAQASSLTISPTTPLYPVVLLGGGTFDIAARAGVSLGLVGNSTTLPEANTNVDVDKNGNYSYFYTYGPTSALNVASSGGDVALGVNTGDLPIIQLPAYLNETYDTTAYTPLYPQTLNVAAFSGSISVQQAIDLFPSASGNLNLLAYGSIAGVPGSTLPFDITMFESDPTQWPNALAPVTSAPAPLINTASGGFSLPIAPLHQDDTQAFNVVAETGSIASSDLIFPKAGNIVAGGDIQDLNYTGKNLNPADVTLIEAGGTIGYTTPTAAETDALLANTEEIQIGGPGFLEVLAGGAINLGDSFGILSTGNLADSRLPSTGASVIVGAGFGSVAAGGIRPPATQSFISSYLAPSSSGQASAYASDLIAYMQQLYPSADANSSASAALTAFQSLTPAQQLPLVAQVLNDILSATGLAHTLSGAPYTPGYDAINTLFPTRYSYSGDINLYFSQIKTEQGGNINLLAPGGSVVVGVVNPPAALGTLKTINILNGSISAAANLGILVLGNGAIEGFADESFDVNTSRILTLEGGDIILWASNGNIDAGRGAKSASAAPPPVIETDSLGNVFVDPINDVNGSGIGQLLSGPGETAGLVNLIAPKGDVNAGDAGIRVAGNLNIAAVQVIGAGNITVVGTATGVPVSQAGAFAGALSGANSLGDASKNAVDQLTQDLGNAANYQQLTESLAPTFIVVKMFCLGVQCETQ